MEINRHGRLVCWPRSSAAALALVVLLGGCTDHQGSSPAPSEPPVLSGEAADFLDTCRAAVDPPWVSAEELERWDAQRTTVYLCGVVGGEWSVRLVGPPRPRNGIPPLYLLDQFDPAGPIEGCFDADGGRRAFLTDGRDVCETTDIVCDTGSIVQG